MKTLFQTLNYLNHSQPKSELDAEMIVAFLNSKYKIPAKTQIFALYGPIFPLDVQTFIKWFSCPYAASNVAIFGNSPVILGCAFENGIEIIGKLEGNRIVTLPNPSPVPYDELSPAPNEISEKVADSLLESSLQFNDRTLTLSPKFIPAKFQRVIFHTASHSVVGLGVINEINLEESTVSLCCYFVYPDSDGDRRVGYSMNETGIVTLRDYIFEPMMENEVMAEERTTDLDGASCWKRFSRELARENKVWKEKIKRIEPLNAEVAKGAAYWYISDKLEVVETQEKKTSTSHFRFLSGNYFNNFEAAFKMKERIAEMFISYLASDKWPDVE